MPTPDGKPIALFVDDDTELLQILVVGLRHMSKDQVVVQTASSALIALELIEQQRPDVIFLDINMPLVNGHQLALALTGDAATADIPLYTLSGYVVAAGGYIAVGSADDHQVQNVTDMSISVGVERHLTKPVTTDELLRCIYAALDFSPTERAQRIEALIVRLESTAQ